MPTSQRENSATDRLIWLMTVTLFCALGAVAGWLLGRFYIQQEHMVAVKGLMRQIIVIALTFGVAVVAARGGSWLANRFLIASLGHFHTLSAVDRVLGVFGVLLGLLFGVLVTLALPSQPGWWLIVKLAGMTVSAIIGMALFQGMRTDMLRVFPQLESQEEEETGGAALPKLLDTNVIIDGRLAEICKTGFVEGTLYVPMFVLEEVQYIADSSDALRRGRGRRGLDILNAMREQMVEREVGGEIEKVAMVQVLHEIPPSVQSIDTVDSKLVALAHEMGAAIITNDFNLNRVAELQEIKVLNINQLAGALKPVVLPGEEMDLMIAKDGKEPDQGVGYLDDGTMVVVANGHAHIGETQRVVINSVYQTVAGKMIFADLKTVRHDGDLFDNSRNDATRNDKGRGNSQRSHSSGGVRRPGRS